MSTIKSVALIGATGTIGPHVLDQLLKHGFEVTVLSRSDKSNLPTGVKTKVVDYNSKESVQSALAGIDAVVVTLGSDGFKAQYTLVDAAVAAGVKRFIPSEFGSVTEEPAVAALPVFADKAAIAAHLLEVSKTSNLTYTFMYTGPFTEFCLAGGLLGITKDGKAEIFDSGDVFFNTSTYARVGESVAAALKHADATANKALYVNSIRTTQNQVLAYAKKHAGPEFTVTNVPLAKKAEEAQEAFEKDPANVYGWLPGMLQGSIFGGDATKSNYLPKDNKVLGLEPLSEEDFEKIIKEYITSSA